MAEGARLDGGVGGVGWEAERGGVEEVGCGEVEGEETQFGGGEEGGGGGCDARGGEESGEPVRGGFGEAGEEEAVGYSLEVGHGGAV